jgi:hypothetical protein
MTASGPRDLRLFLTRPAPDEEESSFDEVTGMIDLILSDNPNDPSAIRFSDMIRAWDNLKNPSWAAGTPRNTADRREVIHAKLKSDAELKQRINERIAVYRLEEPLIIAEEHKDWYEPQPGIRDYYWRTYSNYLQRRRGWGAESLLTLDNTTRAIVECLANPTATEAYASRGLVMGYVQSGKTSNFMGVVARAADAGYRLIIVLAGTWNILRNQTQRRFDKELLGKEFLLNDESYTEIHPADWNEFLEHSDDPSFGTQYLWQRLTRPDIDFKRLKSAIDSLEFDKRDRSKPAYAPENLYHMPAKLLVVKKHSVVLKSLVKDLGLLSTKLAELPALIIDDESDQAGLNTVNSSGANGGARRRPPTNDVIVKLLQLFPRGQYIGYTATPYANALVDPDDAEDLFPKDFIVSLDRPAGYMGVSDFLDPASNYQDLDPQDYSIPEIAFIRRVNNAVGFDDEDLQNALHDYVLTGALKLFRLASNPQKYKESFFKHHTMLVHTSHLKGQQRSLTEHLQFLWNQCAFNSPDGKAGLQHRWEEGFAPVCAAIGDDLIPAKFSDLTPHLAEAIKRIDKGTGPLLLVNSDSDQAPDFNAAPVWKVIIGGNKLSRGYTIEGLTISYYRRVVGVADTLMQMGRWFGFRPGYRDLVRVYLGVNEGRRGDVDLVALFKEVCFMEERFREDIKRYLRLKGAEKITPKQVPPLIEVTGNLPPTAKNKMFNARLTNINFGGAKSMPTLVAADDDGTNANLRAAEKLLKTTNLVGRRKLQGQMAAKLYTCDALLFEADTAAIAAFLKEFHWLKSDYKFPSRPAEITLQIEFLEEQRHQIDNWIIIAPQRAQSFGHRLTFSDLPDLSVKERHRPDGKGFPVIGEPRHRAFAEYLSGTAEKDKDLNAVNAETTALCRPHLGVMLLYPVRSKAEDPASIGFELFFPKNNLGFGAKFTVVRS